MRRGSRTFWGLTVLALGSGCAPPAQSEEPGPLLSEKGGVASVTFDPVFEYLSQPPLPETRQTALLNELKATFEALSSAPPSGETIQRVDRVLGEASTLADWRPLVRAELLARAGDPEGVGQARAALDPRTPLDSRWGWRFQVEAHLLSGDTAVALEAALSPLRQEEQTSETSGIPAPSPAARAEAGRLALILGDTLRARSLLESVVEPMATVSPGGNASSIFLAARLLHSLPGERSPEQTWALGVALHTAGEWEASLLRLQPLLGSGSRPVAEEEELRVRMGHSLVELKRPREALALLPAPVGLEGARGTWARQALFWAGRAHVDLGDVRAATSAFADIGRAAPGDPLSEEGLLLLLGKGAFSGRGDVERLLLELGVSSASGEVEAVRLGTGPFLGGDFTRAAATFERYLSEARRTSARQQAAYWAALARERLGEADRARTLRVLAWEEDPLSFYGLLAGEPLQRPILEEGLEVGPPAGRVRRGELDNALLRLKVHQILPTPGSFAFELDRLQEHFFSRGEDVYDFAEALLEGGFPLQGVVLGREIHRREGAWNLRLLRIVHPFPHRDRIVQEARARGLDPFFVAGLIRQESLFHPSIRSSAGAVGLMQLMPATAREVARSLGLRYEEDLLTDPAYNIQLGTHFLSSMLRRYEGRSQDALSAYNAGPSRASQWRSRPEAADRDVFMEHIPFRETRNYVKVVQQYARIYAALYGCLGFQPCLGMEYSEILARSPYSTGGPLAR